MQTGKQADACSEAVQFQASAAEFEQKDNPGQSQGFAGQNSTTGTRLDVSISSDEQDTESLAEDWSATEDMPSPVTSRQDY